MCYITNTQTTEEQNQQRNFARFFAPNQNYQYPFAFQLNGKPINDYQDESSEGYDSQEQYQYGYPMQQQPQNYVYLDSKPFNQYGFNNQNVYNNENEIFNILGPINENNNQEQNVQESGEYYDDAIYNQVYNDNDAPFVFAKNEEEVFYQPQCQENNIYNNFDAPIYNNNMSAPQHQEQLQPNYQSQPEFQQVQYYPQQQPQYVPQGYEMNGYQEQAPQQFLQPQYPQMNEAPIAPQSNMQNYQSAQIQQKQEYSAEVQSSCNLGDDENNKYDDQADEDFEKEGSEEQNEIIDKIKKSNKKNVVKNIMSAFKRFIQDIQSDVSQSSSPSNLDSSSNLSCSTASVAAKPSKISNLKQNITNSDSYQINVAFERDNVLAIYNNSKTKPDSIDEMGKKFKRYISSKQFNHYTIRLLVQHQNYGQIFKYFLENHANSWLSNSKVDDPYGHKIMIEFLMASYEDINIIEKLKKHEKRKAIYQ